MSRRSARKASRRWASLGVLCLVAAAVVVAVQLVGRGNSDRITTAAAKRADSVELPSTTSRVLSTLPPSTSSSPSTSASSVTPPAPDPAAGAALAGATGGAAVGAVAADTGSSVTCTSPRAQGGRVAWAKPGSVQVFDSPGGGVKTSFSNPNRSRYNAALTFLVLEESGSWLRVQLPARPNESTGWVKASDVTVKATSYRLVVDVSSRSMCLFDGANVKVATTVAVGKSATPTPYGLYFIQVVLDTQNPGGAYGPWALGLSAFSNVLYQFGSGDGQIAIHGTNQPNLLGQAVSNGCIRVRNSIITDLARTVDEGVPVELVA